MAKMRYTIWLVAFLPLVACGLTSSETSTAIARQCEASGRTKVNLAEAVPRPWERVCILGPYTGNKEVRTILGFDWNVESRTSIHSNDGIALLLFVRGKDVVEYVEYPRNQGDFSNLTMQCFAREKATFVQQQRPTKGWAGLFPASET